MTKAELFRTSEQTHVITAYYSIRLIYLTFITNTNSKKEVYIKVHESNRSIIIVSLLLLAFGSTFVGYFGKELILSNIISPVIPNYVNMAPLLLSLFGALLAKALSFDLNY